MGKRRRLKFAEFLAVLGLFAAVLGAFIALAAAAGRRQRTAGIEADYYFLVETCKDSTAAAVAGRVYGAGGAGYLLHSGEAVVVACYYTERDAERVQSAMREKGTETKIVELSAEKIYLEGAETAFAERTTANAETVSACAKLLYDAANGLERAEIGQPAARDAVRGVAASLAGLCKGNGDGFFDLWNAELYGVSRACGEISEEIVFAKDLRRVQVRLLCALVSFQDYFS